MCVCVGGACGVVRVCVCVCVWACGVCVGMWCGVCVCVCGAEEDIWDLTGC